MTQTDAEEQPDIALHVIEALEGLEQASLEAIRQFIDTVDGMLPDVHDDGRRRKILDSAIEMVEQLVGTSSQIARNVVAATKQVMRDFETNAALHKT